jgi:hypothetical protein
MNPISSTSRLFSNRTAVRSLLQAAALGGVLAGLTGCVVEDARPRPRVTVIETAPPPPPRETVIVREAPAPRPAEVVVIKVAPPAPRREVIVEAQRPSPRHVWIAGYWVWSGGRHEWRAGHWELPPREHAVWVAPRWEHRGEGYVFIEGVWR